MDKQIYIDNGYKDREDYLQCLADDFGLDFNTVDELSSVMPNEDFDGLVSLLEDMC